MNKQIIAAAFQLYQATNRAASTSDGCKMGSVALEIASKADVDKLDDEDFEKYLEIQDGLIGPTHRLYEMAVSRYKERGGEYLIEWIAWMARNVYVYTDPTPPYINALCALYLGGVGDPARWHLEVAEWYQAYATGTLEMPDKWKAGDPVISYAIARAAEALESAISQGAGAVALADPVAWDEKWLPIITDEKYRRLRSESIARRARI